MPIRPRVQDTSGPNDAFSSIAYWGPHRKEHISHGAQLRERDGRGRGRKRPELISGGLEQRDNAVAAGEAVEDPAIRVLPDGVVSGEQRAGVWVVRRHWCVACFTP